MKFEDYRKEGIIKNILDVEKNNYLLFLEQVVDPYLKNLEELLE